MPSQAPNPDYRLGALYSLATAGLLAIQEPFSALAARSLTSPEFVGLTQIALLFSVPMLIAAPASRRAFAAVLFKPANWSRLAVLFLVGVGGLLLYNIGLSSAHPIITAGVLNLSPFWAALVAAVVMRKAIPGSSKVFSTCFVVAFVGTMAIAWSQLKSSELGVVEHIWLSITHGKWIFALPMPIFFALSGTLVGKWFAGLDESGVIAANFVVSAIILIPCTSFLAYQAGGFDLHSESVTAILMLLIGTLASSAAGRVFYQIALTTTDNDNGFVTMFFLIIPAVSALISLPLSLWIPELHVSVSPTFLSGLLLIMIPVFIFSTKTWRRSDKIIAALAAASAPSRT